MIKLGSGDKLVAVERKAVEDEENEKAKEAREKAELIKLKIQGKKNIKV